MSTDTRYVYLLVRSDAVAYHRDRTPIWNDSPDPPTVEVYDDAWTAIDAGRRALDDVEWVTIEPDAHQQGVLWVGRYRNTEIVVRRREVQTATAFAE